MYLLRKITPEDCKHRKERKLRRRRYVSLVCALAVTEVNNSFCSQSCVLAHRVPIMCGMLTIMINLSHMGFQYMDA